MSQDARLSPAACLRHSWFLAGDHAMLNNSLAKSLEGIKAWNAKRKFKGAVKAVSFFFFFLLSKVMGEGDKQFQRKREVVLIHFIQSNKTIDSQI